MQEDVLASIKINLVDAGPLNKELRRNVASPKASSSFFSSLNSIIMSGIVGMSFRRKNLPIMNNKPATFSKFTQPKLVPSRFSSTEDLRMEILRRAKQSERNFRREGLSQNEIENRLNQQLTRHTGIYMRERYSRGEINNPLIPHPQVYNPTDAPGNLPKDAGLFSTDQNAGLSSTQKNIINRERKIDIALRRLNHLADVKRNKIQQENSTSIAPLKTGLIPVSNLRVNTNDNGRNMEETSFGNVKTDLIPVSNLRVNTNDNGRNMEETSFGNVKTDAIAGDKKRTTSDLLRWREGKK